MRLIALGMNHTTANVSLRESVVFAPNRMRKAMTDAVSNLVIEELAIVSTCNRMELYGVANGEIDHAHRDICGWLSDYHGVELKRLQSHLYRFESVDAVQHVLRVASGLDSMVLGEPQILGQVKTAYHEANEAGTLGPWLSRLFQHAFSVAKRVRTDTDIGVNPVSVAYAAVSMAKTIFSNLGQTQALLIGAGETIERVAEHLREQSLQRIVIANRTVERAKRVADHCGGHAISLEEVPAALVNADIVVSSTASPLPILGKGTVEKVLKQRKHRPMFMMDIAVPRDIEPEVADLDDVYLYTVDDLEQVVEENRRSRQDAARQAEAIVLEGCDEFMRQMRALTAVAPLKAYRSKIEELRDQELQKALQMMAAGAPADEVLQRFSRNLSNKIMHAPSAALRQAGEEGRIDCLDWSYDLLGLDRPDDDKPSQS